MIWHPARLEWRSNTFTGCESPSILQWYTALSVTSATVFREIHFQKVTSSVMVCAFILLFISMLKIWRVLAAKWSKGTGSRPPKNVIRYTYLALWEKKFIDCFVFKTFQTGHSESTVTGKSRFKLCKLKSGMRFHLTGKNGVCIFELLECGYY